jgi:hypothetical protein
MTLNPILSSLRGVDLSDPKTRKVLAPVYAAVQSQVQTLQANAAPALGTPANPALATKYVAADILGNFQLPVTRSQVAELSRAHHDALPIEEKERIRASLVMLHMESIVKALGRTAMDDAWSGGSAVSGPEVNASAGIGSHKIIIPLQKAAPRARKRPEKTAPSAADLAALTERMKQRLPRNSDVNYEDYLVDAAAVEFWMAEYQRITGTKPVFAKDLVEFIRDHGSALMDLHERRARIGVVSFSGKKSNEQAMKTLVESMLRAIHGEGISLSDVALVSGLTDLGGVKAAYDAAHNFSEVETQGITAGKASVYPVAAVDKAAVIGFAFGSESRLFLETANYLIGMGGGGQGEKELRWFIKKKGDRAFLAEGFLEIKADGNLAPGAVEKIEATLGGHRVPNAERDPQAAGAVIGKAIAQLIRSEEHQKSDTPLLKLAIESSPSKLVEVEKWAEANSSRYRIIRILNAVKKKLLVKGLPESAINDSLAEAGTNILAATAGIDNRQQNSLWQQKAKEALAATSGEVASVAADVGIDIMFASWFGVQGARETNSYFDAKISNILHGMILPKRNSPHTFNITEYGELRLDLATLALLKAEDSNPEIFLGSSEELTGYYASKGYRENRQIADSNGTTYLLFANGDKKLVVVHGVDSESRLAQVSALMQTNDVDISKVKVRGELQRLRETNRNLLELSLSQLDKPIAGVVVGDKNNSIEGLAQRAGTTPGEIKLHPMTQIGPFRFEKVEVTPTGADKSYYLLAFAPAYGELSEDLVAAAYNAGARNFMLAGAGGSLMANDKVGSLHNVVSSEYRGRTIDLKNVHGIEVIKVQGAPDVHNITSPTPLEQTREWADQVRGRGAQDVDQETYHVFRALEESIAHEAALNGLSGNRVRLQVGLHQSDVVGSNGLDAGTVDIQYAPNIRRMTDLFVDRMGIAEIVGRSGKLPVSGAVPGVLAGQKALQVIEINKLNLPTPDLSTVWQNGWGDSLTQFKGQKRVFEVSTTIVGPKERAFFKNLISELNPKRFWITIKQSDPNYADILNLSHEHDFETILIADKMSDVHSKPDFILKAANDGEAQAFYDELVRPGKNDPYETNTAQHYRFHLGDGHLKNTREGFIYQTGLGSDDAEEMASDINKEARAGRKAVKVAIAQFFESEHKPAPKFIELEEMPSFLHGRRPVLISGASKKSWPNVTVENQKLVEDTLEKLMAHLNPAKYVIVTGGTDFGVEKIAHQIAARRGFEILGTISENTGPQEVSTLIRNFVPLAINWFGKSRPVLAEIVKPFNGLVLFQGGGAILKEEIELAVRLNVPMFLQRDPEGAAAEAAKQYPQHSFSSYQDLKDRLK